MKTLFELFLKPFYLDQDNASGVIVKDSTGRIVYDNFYEFPDEFRANMREQAIEEIRAVAHYLVTQSEKA